MVIPVNQGFLSEYFNGIVVKRLSAVEANPNRSNQHEFNGIAKFKEILGLANEKITIPAQFVYLASDEGNNAASSNFVTWYDARINHPTRTEHRLYYSTTDVSERFKEGDLLVIARKKDGDLLILAAEQHTTAEQQVRWLFNLPEDIGSNFTYRDLEGDEDIKLSYAGKYILDELGIVIKDYDENYLQEMLSLYGGGFPTTIQFSDFARKTVPNVNTMDDPDSSLVAWMEQEEKLFRTLERHIVSKQLHEGFQRTNEQQVDNIMSLMLSAQNRRKSRAGQALENHLEQVFKQCNIKYSRAKYTENKNKPDFIFPNIESYHNANLDSELLTMLASKSTCKDRWRQVLSEANRIKQKHLLTLEPAISRNQTNEMQIQQLQLVVPKALHYTYQADQKSWLMSLKEFIMLVKERQRKAEQ